MIYKLFIEEGLYQDKDTKEPRNLMEANIAYTPEGINVGWTELENLETALEYFNLELVPEPEEEEEWKKNY
jgi:hypothetical protein